MAVNNLIKKLILLCVAESLFSTFIYYAVPVDKDGYIFAIHDKEMLLSSSKPPRIIFVGGSNVAFGLNSELVEKKFELPVINLGLHLFLGLETSLNIVERYATKGDIVVIIPEYEYFDGGSQGMYGSNDILSDFLEIDPANVRYIARAKWMDLPLIGFGVSERKINREIDSLLNGSVDRGVYVRSSFNSYGDVIGHLGKTFDPNKITTNAVLQKDWVPIMIPFDILEEFHQKIIDKGGIVLFDFPSLRMQNCENTGSEKFDTLLIALRTYTTISVLSTPYDRCYPDDYFYNTQYHLNALGRQIRTQQVIRSLLQELNKPRP